jgi:cation diffusion facilitator CzcD-associated flavoprotein CzcO
VSATHGIGTATTAPASIQKATPTNSPSPQDLLNEWDWNEYLADRPETLRYLNHVADKFDLRRDIQFRATRTLR